MSRLFSGFIALTLSAVYMSCGERRSSPESFELHPDFQMALVASEPVVLDPVDFVFDAKGDTYVLEMPGYPLSDEQSRLIKLIDSDKDGVFDERILFATDLSQATSILPYDDGFLVAAPPQLLFIKDTDGDQKADLRQIIMDGFPVGNLQHNFNGLSYGLDNWIYAANGGNNGSPFWAGKPDSTFALRRGDFRLRPRDQKFERTGRSSGGHVISFDDWGRVYMTHNVYHISTMEFLDKYYHGQTLVPPDTRHYISDHEENGLGRIYTIGQQVTRVNHPEQSGYFSGGCGITYYGGGAFPEEFQGNVFVADVVVNVIHRDKINPHGTSVTASRGRPGAEFLASSDRDFRPVNMTVGPDGALYVVDIHRTIIEHPEWIPDELEKDMDLAAGKDKGRIYKITAKPGNSHTWHPPAEMDNQALVAGLSSPNQWMRLNSQRLLIEGKAVDAAPALESKVRGQDARGIVHALWTLEGLGKLNVETVLFALTSIYPEVRMQALQLAEYFSTDKGIQARLIELLADENAQVRRQAALSISVLPDDLLYSSHLTGQLIQMVKLYPEDLWTMQAVMLASRNVSIALIMKLGTDEAVPFTEAVSNLYTMLAIETASESETLASLLKYLAEKGDGFPPLTNMLSGLNTAVEKGLSDDPPASLGTEILQSIAHLETKTNSAEVLASLWSLRELLSLQPPLDRQAMLRKAKQLIVDRNQSTTERRAQLALLPFTTLDDKKDVLFGLLLPDQPQALQLEAIDQLADESYPALADELIGAWPSFGPSVRRKATDILIYNPGYHHRLLAALESDELKIAEFNFDLERRRRLLKSKDEEVVTRAGRLFSDAGVVQREEAIEKMRPALLLAGDQQRGSKVFSVQCSQCHRYENDGIQVGPDLTEISRKSKETLLHDILDPNAAADPEYISHVVTTEDGVVSGIISTENDEEITVMTMGGMEKKVLRRQIKEIRSTGLSLMPEGLEAVIDQQQMADLLAYLQQNNI